MNKKLVIYILAFFVSFVSCTSDYEEINKSPNYPSVGPMDNVLANVIQSVSDLFDWKEMDYPAGYVGYIARSQYTDENNYAGTPTSGVWSAVYVNISSDIQSIQKQAEEADDLNMFSVADILSVYSFQMLVDIYGKIPYFEAGMGQDNLYPVYDNEKDIYYDLLDRLKTAADVLDPVTASANNFGKGDLLFGGDITRWKKFANSLRLRLAVRISKVDLAKATEVITEVIGNPAQYPVLESNADNVYLAYSSSEWIEPWTSMFRSEDDYRIAAPIVNTLLNYSDPRIEYYAELYDGDYVGLPVGSKGGASHINDLFVDNENGSVYFMKYAEVEFIKAEIYQEGLGATGDAQAAYEAGITASCQEYEIDAASITDYLDNAGVLWTDDVNQIYEQKWIALFRQSWEAWAEMRRTDIPTLDPATNTTRAGHNRIPFRFAYPDSERRLNAENVPSSTEVNEDDVFWGYQIWWDTRTGVN